MSPNVSPVSILVPIPEDHSVHGQISDTHASDKNGNSADTDDFDLPTDSEGKSMVFRVCSLSRPHMLTFHLSWINFFVSFVSTFAPVALVPVIRDAVNMTSKDIGTANIAAVGGSVVARVIMGSVCDTFGPRYGHSIVNIAMAPAIAGMAIIQSASGFIVCRLFIGFSLATFVANQYWSSVMFNVKIVGVVNATGAGWGNLGGGVTQLLMPLLYRALVEYTEPFIAWRITFFIPYAMHMITGALVLFYGQDLPQGNFAQVHKKGSIASNAAYFSISRALRNYRTYCMFIIYGLSFGVELTMNNIITPYLFDQFGVGLTLAGILGACFGLMNLFARSTGGILSDFFSRKFGMRGRLWVLYTVQTIQGIMCVLVGTMQNTLAGTMITMVLFSLFVQASEGAQYSIIPFISRRSLGAVSGIVSAGGNLGSVILQIALFRDESIETYIGLRIMGAAVIIGMVAVWPIYFPMWGGMCLRRRQGVTEEDYYLREFTMQEKQQGLQEMTLKFACEARTQRTKYVLR